MKNVLLILILSFLFVGCDQIHNDDTIEWIDTHKLPIECKLSGWTGLCGLRVYTLIDADRKIYNTGGVTLKLPDTIHIIKIQEYPAK